MSKLSKEELQKKLATFVGLEIGPPQEPLEPVNESMIFHWCEALGDNNPIYTDPEAAKNSVHRGIVAPPAMLQVWSMRLHALRMELGGAAAHLRALAERRWSAPA